MGYIEIYGVYYIGRGFAIESVWFEDFCEKSISIVRIPLPYQCWHAVSLTTLTQKEDPAGAMTIITGGGAYYASDKIIQHNGCGRSTSPMQVMLNGQSRVYYLLVTVLYRGLWQGVLRMQDCALSPISVNMTIFYSDHPIESSLPILKTGNIFHLKNVQYPTVATCKLMVSCLVEPSGLQGCAYNKTSSRDRDRGRNRF